MAKQAIRQPKQRRSIEKKQSILKASYALFSAKGYYKTNTAEIAQEAGVSTGIVYSYFQDKKDILLEVVRFYIASLSDHFQPLLSTPVNKNDLPSIIEQFIDISIASHTMNIEAHNEFFALSFFEKEISLLFSEFENDLLAKLYRLLSDAGYSEINLLEKIRIGYGMIEQICHDYVGHELSKDKLNIMKSLAVCAITGLLDNTI